MAVSIKKRSVETQTVILVSPHVLDETYFAKVCSYKKCQTEVSINPAEERRKFLSSLQYIPYSDIKENSIRIIDLPRKVKLHFINPTFDLHKASKLQLIQNMSLSDDDAVAELCIDVIRWCQQGRHQRRVTSEENECQTDLMVAPHILEDTKVAKVFMNSESQTIATIPVDAGKSSNI